MMPTATPKAMVEMSSEASVVKRSSFVARACSGITSPLRNTPGAMNRVIATSRGSLYRAAMSGAHSATATDNRMPMNAESHSRLRQTRSLRSFAWMIAPVMPKSRTSSAMPMTAPTIAMRPKSAGVSRRANTIVEIICNRARPQSPPIVTTTPRAAFCARFWCVMRCAPAWSCRGSTRCRAAGPAGPPRDDGS